MTKMVMSLDDTQVKGEWEDGTDPEVALGELVQQGYDPDEEYVVGSTHGGAFEEVHRGDLRSCLKKASELGKDSYHVVMPADQVQFVPKVEVH